MSHELDGATDHVICRHCGRAFLSVNVAHLRFKHDYAGDHPVHKYKQAFHLPTAACRETCKKIARARNRYWAKTGQHWTRRRIIATIRRLHRRGRSLREKSVPHPLFDAGYRLFGSWGAAIQAAGFDYEATTGVRRWSQQKVVERIQDLHSKGVPINRKYIQQRYSFLYRAGIRWFPRSWSKAPLASGFDPAEHRVSQRYWDQAAAANWVRSQLKRGQSIQARFAPSKLFRFVSTDLGLSWADSVESLGIRDQNIQRKRVWSKAKVVEEIRRLNAEGQRLNYQSVALADQSLILQVRKYFGSWDSARAAARV
jgi:hypothetical protein